jgi:predicted metal-dependent hydrolase
MSEKRLLSRIRKDGRRIAKRFRLRYLRILQESPRVRARYGSCDEDRVIRLRLYRLKDRKFMRYPILINTLCHELAHLKYMDHSKNFKQLNEIILKWARKRKIYCPVFRRVARV